MNEQTADELADRVLAMLDRSKFTAGDDYTRVIVFRDPRLDWHVIVRGILREEHVSAVRRALIALKPEGALVITVSEELSSGISLGDPQMEALGIDRLCNMLCYGAEEEREDETVDLSLPPAERAELRQHMEEAIREVLPRGRCRAGVRPSAQGPVIIVSGLRSAEDAVAVHQSLSHRFLEFNWSCHFPASALRYFPDMPEERGWIVMIRKLTIRPDEEEVQQH